MLQHCVSRWNVYILQKMIHGPSNVNFQCNYCSSFPSYIQKRTMCQFTCNEQKVPDRVRFTGHCRIVGPKVWIWLYATHLAPRTWSWPLDFWKKILHPCYAVSFYWYLIHGSTNPRLQVAVATKFCSVVHNVCGPSVWNFLHVKIPVHKILRQLVDFWKFCAHLFYDILSVYR